MARYTFDTTAEQDAAIEVSHKLQSPDTPFDTFVTGAIAVRLKEITDQFIEMRVQKLVDAYRAATPEQRAAVDAVLELALVPSVIVK